MYGEEGGALATFTDDKGKERRAGTLKGLEMEMGPGGRRVLGRGF